MYVWTDQHGIPFKKTDLTQEQAAPTTRGIRRPDVNEQAAGLTPQKLARILRESIDGDPEAYLALAEDMEERDLHYAGVLGIRKTQVSGLPVTVTAASNDARDIEIADFVREFVERDEFETELFDILDALGKGFSATEILWETSEKQWMPKALKYRLPTWFDFDPTDRETLLLKDVEGNQPLKPFSWIVHQAKVKSGLPIRGGIARGVTWAFLFKSFTMKDWAIFCEAYGQPLRLGKYGEGASDADKDILLRAVSNIGVDYAAIVPQSMTVEFVKAEVTGSQALYESRANFLDRQVSKLVLGQTGTTDAIAGGHAVGKVHDKVREDIERSDAKQLSATINRDLIIPLCQLNFGKLKKYPKVTIGRPDEVDVDKLVSHVTKLVPFGLKVGMSTMRDKIGLPDPDKDEEILRPDAFPVTVTDTGQGDQQIKAAAKRGMQDALLAANSSQQRDPARAADKDAIDNTVSDILADQGWHDLVSPIVSNLENEIAAATSISQVEAILRNRLETGGINALAQILAESKFAAYIAGAAGETLTDEA